MKRPDFVSFKQQRRIRPVCFLMESIIAKLASTRLQIFFKIGGPK